MNSYLFSCEHATCAVPEAYRELFRGEEDVVESGEGWEPGSLNLAQAFSMKFRTPLVHGDVTRLLIDLEKDGDERWSRFALKLPEATRAKVADRHERPFRAQLLQRIAEDLRRHASVLHVIVHTSAEIDGRVRLETPAEVPLAQAIASAWRNQMRAAELDVLHFHDAERNATEAFLAQEFAGQSYAQLRLTVAQSFFLEGRPWRWETLKKFLVDSLPPAVDEARALSGPGFPSTAPV
jgi:predicted N-formylglutamate amidohydrolase